MDASWAKLPEDIKLKAALKLPIRDLFRAKLVCKSWCKSVTASSAYAWMHHLMICGGSWETADFEYLPRLNWFTNHIVSCSRDGIMLMHRVTSLFGDTQSPWIVTNPFTKLLHAVPYSLPPGLGFATRLHASVHDTSHSFKLVVVLSSSPCPGEAIQMLHVSVYQPETGWHNNTGLINLGGDRLVLLNVCFPMQPLVFDGEALYFLTTTSSSTFLDSGKYTLNRVHVGEGDETYRLERLVSWSSLPMGMWPMKNRVHPKLVLCSGQLLLVGTSFTEKGDQGPIVILVLDRETRRWKVLLGDVRIPGYVAKRVGNKIDTMYCRGSLCATYKECFCYEDYMVMGWDDEVVLSFRLAGNAEDRSLNFSYNLRSRRWSQFGLPVVDEFPVSRRQMVRVYLSTRGRIPETSDQSLLESSDDEEDI